MPICEKCSVNHDGTYGSGRFCSVSCANSRVRSKETREKIRQTMLSKKIPKKCPVCNGDVRRKSQTCCSRSCSMTLRNKNNPNLARLAGLKSAQSRVTRSKNEIYFADLCIDEFADVECNEAIFNGWDADVIIHDHKIAVLWNGKWHYEQIGAKHSLKQVQNRDKIKVKEIKKYGYIPYIIKDMGKHNKNFVEYQFQIFMSYVKTL